MPTSSPKALTPRFKWSAPFAKGPLIELVKTRVPKAKLSRAFSSRERTALAWTEALTNIQQGHAPDEVYEKVRQHFTEKELVRLSIAITQINAWNRIAP